MLLLFRSAAVLTHRLWWRPGASASARSQQAAQRTAQNSRRASLHVNEKLTRAATAAAWGVFARCAVEVRKRQSFVAVARDVGSAAAAAAATARSVCAGVWAKVDVALHYSPLTTMRANIY